MGGVVGGEGDKGLELLATAKGNRINTYDGLEFVAAFSFEFRTLPSQPLQKCG